MRKLSAVLLLVLAGCGSLAARDITVTGVAGRSWLNHLNRSFDETSMGKTGHLGPVSLDRDPSAPWQLSLSPGIASEVTLRGADLYRLNCQSCHGEAGMGAPPEINSVINPVRATSVAMVLERMKATGMNLSHSDALNMASQSRAALLLRMHKGGQDMPAFPHLDEPEVRALLAYLKQLSGLPGAQLEQASVKESPIRVGEHVVKSTCHICHAAYGVNPTPQQIAEGAIPPLSALTSRVTLPEFVRKVTAGSPIMMGEPAAACRGRMPVFYYLSQDEAADVYLYLTLYPPYKFAALDTSEPPGQSNRAAADLPLAQMATASIGFGPEAPGGSGPSPDFPMQLAPSIGLGLFLTLLMAGGFAFTVRECMRLSAVAEGRFLIPRAMPASGALQQPQNAQEDERLIA